MTAARRWPYLEASGPVGFAHRGGTDRAPENTLAAFADAVALGYRYLETDVHASADGRLVAFHDDDLGRMAGRPGRIGDLAWSEIAALRVAGEPIPLLEDLLAAFPAARINIDPKTDAAAALLPEVLRRTRAVARVCIGAFSDARLRRLRRAVGPALCTSMGPSEVTWLRLASLGLPVRGVDPELPPACVQVPPRWHGLPLVDRRFLAKAHRLGLPVHVWTINGQAEMERLLDLGVDGLMTDRVRALRAVLAGRGHWPGAPPPADDPAAERSRTAST